MGSTLPSVEITQIVGNIILRFSGNCSAELLINTAEQLWQFCQSNSHCQAANITLGHDAIAITPFPEKIMNTPLLLSALKVVLTSSSLKLIVSPELTIAVSYAGEDIEDVAGLLNFSVGEFIAWHTDKLWTVRFLGFMPGFGYLTRDNDESEDQNIDCSSLRKFFVPRKISPRAHVPRGSVALGGPYCSIYPKDSPGGWQLIGNTTCQLWDLQKTPPATLLPGMKVKFVELCTF